MGVHQRPQKFCSIEIEYFLLANDAGFSSAASNKNRSLKNTLSGYNFTEMVSWLSRNLRKALTLFRWSCQLIHKFQCCSTKYFNFKSVNLRTLFALTLGNLPTGDKQLDEHFDSMN